MKYKKDKIVIGIPAYNEGQNIGQLLGSLLKQRLDRVELERIIVNSDGSNDDTAAIVKSFGDSRVVLFDDGKRKGQAIRQNEIIERCRDEVLVLLNADVYIQDSEYLQKLTEPIFEGEAQLTSSRVAPLAPRNLIEAALINSYSFKEEMFEKFENGANIFTCKGAARAMSPRFYQQFRFGKSVGEDAYTFLYCKAHQMEYAYVPEATAFIRLPDNIDDYLKQSTRFIDSRSRFESEFGTEWIKKLYRIPVSIKIGAFVKHSLRHPLRMSIYLGLFALANVKAHMRGKRDQGDVWETAMSSKKLI